MKTLLIVYSLAFLASTLHAETDLKLSGQPCVAGSGFTQQMKIIKQISKNVYQIQGVYYPIAILETKKPAHNYQGVLDLYVRKTAIRSMHLMNAFTRTDEIRDITIFEECEP